MNDFKVIGQKGQELFNDELAHPGELLKDELEFREIMQKDFAAKLGIRPSHFSELLNGKRHISPQLALKLERELGISADYWMRLQASYFLDKARLEEEYC